MQSDETIRERLARLRWQGRGVFPPPANCCPSETKEDLLEKVKEDLLEKVKEDLLEKVKEDLLEKVKEDLLEKVKEDLLEKVEEDLLEKVEEALREKVPFVDNPRELKTLVSGGDKVTAIDYAMDWKNHRKKEAPSTTHELTFDRENGFDSDYLYVSGMNVDMIARVNKTDPTKQDLFKFPKIFHQDAQPQYAQPQYDPQDSAWAQPHTLRFANVKSEALKGKLWVGLEEQGIIVKLDMIKLLKKYKKKLDLNIPVDLCAKTDYKSILDCRIKAKTVPFPINTRPHGFCFDAKCEYIWFTGKLTNTVSRIKVDGGDDTVQHFALPTLGAIPIYLALGPDNNVWGTCVSNSIIFRVTTGKYPVVHEMSISDAAKDRRPIAIKPDPRGLPFMWFTNEAGHSVCRLDTNAFEKEISEGTDVTGKCSCSVACKFLFRGSSFVHKVITEFPIPKVNHNMKVAGLAIRKDGAIWVQSYMDPIDNMIENLPDYIIKLRFNEHDPTSTHDSTRSSVVNMTGVPIDYFELPTKDTILHRITVAPDEDESVWFTELQSDRIGTITFEERNFGTKRGEIDDVQRGDKKRART